MVPFWEGIHGLCYLFGELDGAIWDGAGLEFGGVEDDVALGGHVGRIYGVHDFLSYGYDSK